MDSSFFNSNGITCQLRYTHNGTNPMPSLDVYVEGLWYQTNLPNTVVQRFVTYTITASNTPIDPWYRVRSLTVFGPTASSTGDTVSVVWPGYEYYGDAPYHLDKVTIDERVKFLQAFTWTTDPNFKWTNGMTASGTNYDEGGEAEYDITKTDYGNDDAGFTAWQQDQPAWDKLAWWTLPPGDQPWEPWPTYEGVRGTYTDAGVTNPLYYSVVDVFMLYEDWAEFVSAEYTAYPPGGSWYGGGVNRYQGSSVKQWVWMTTNDTLKAQLYTWDISTNYAHQDEFYTYTETSSVPVYPIAWWIGDTVAKTNISPV